MGTRTVAPDKSDRNGERRSEHAAAATFGTWRTYRAERPVPASDATVEDYAQHWLATYRGRTRRGLAPSTRCDYRRSLEQYAVPFFRGLRVRDVTPGDVYGYVSALEGLGQATSSVRKNFAPVSAMLATALEEGFFKANPAKDVRLRSVDVSSGHRVLTARELHAFFAAVPREWTPFFRLLIQSGLRVSEAIGLLWGDVILAPLASITIRRQLVRGEVRPPKTPYGTRTLPVSRRMASDLSELRSATAFSADTDPVFCTPRGTPHDASNVRRRVLQPAAHRAGLEPLGFHAFRHTCASLLFADGRNIKQIQHWLGHHDPAYTLSTYVQLMPAQLGSAELFDEAIAGGAREPGSSGDRCGDTS